MNQQINIRIAKEEDYNQIWQIIEKVISTGDTYVFSPDSSRKKMLDFWCGKDKYTYVALLGQKIVGTFFMKDNFPDLGSHIANAGYITAPSETGKGIGKSMGKFSIQEAKRLGYKAMQFNMVVKTNDKAIRLWQKLGFKIKGEIPEAFNHKEKGLTDAYILWKKL